MLLSASQIGTYLDCKRKWGFKSIAKLPDPSGPAAELGKEVDDTQLQPYLRDGRPFDYTRDSGYIAASALAYLPEPKTLGLEVQKHFVFRSRLAPDELSYQGYIDLWLPEGGAPDMPAAPEGVVIPNVKDFKTTGNVTSKWVKTPKILETDVQAMIYATWVMASTPYRTVDLDWIYMQTRGARKVKRHHLRVEGKHVSAQFARIDAIGVEMMQTRKAVEAASSGDLAVAVAATIPATPCEACRAYNGCPYRSQCNFSPADYESESLPQLESIDMSDTASLLAQLKAKRSGAVTAAPAVAPVVQHAPVQVAAVVEAVGINPPESRLPPPAPPETPFVQAVAEPAAKPKRGRPAGSGAKEAAVLIDAIERGALSTPAPSDEAFRHQRIGALVVELASLLGAA